MDIENLLAFINKTHNTKYSIIKKFSEGYRGAYEIVDQSGIRAVLKCSTDPKWINQLKRVLPVVERMRLVNYPTPTFLFIGISDDEVPYHVQTLIDGSPLKAITKFNIDRILEIIEIQAGLGKESDNNWSDYVYNVVYNDASGWKSNVSSYSSESSELVSTIEVILAQFRDTVLPTNDVVHGDFLTDNILQNNGEIVSIIDFESSGKGCRAIDLAQLFVWSDIDLELRKVILDRMILVSNKSISIICLAYEMICIINFMIENQTPNDVEASMILARKILGYIQELL